MPDAPDADRVDDDMADAAEAAPEGLGADALVIGTEDATPLSYWAALAEGRYLQLDDVVVTDRPLPGGELVRLSGVVTNVRARHEGARFDSDVHLISDGILPAEVSEAAEVTVTRVEPEVFVPPRPGSAVRRATGDERDHALYFDDMAAKLPLGLGRDQRPVFANLEFLDGTRGAHVNISGISGVATKTTYASFLLYSMFHSGVLGGEAANTKALIFNVKGEDLLFLDHANSELTDAHRQRYAQLGLPDTPFQSVAIYAPPRPGDPNGVPDVAARATGVRPYYWTIAEFCSEQLLPFVFADAEDERQQYTMVLQAVTTILLRDGQKVGDDGAWKVGGSEAIRTYSQLVDLIVAEIDPDTGSWSSMLPPVGAGTLNAFARRLISSVKALDRLIRADIAVKGSHRVNAVDESAQVTVVDLHMLPDRAKRFVVGTTVRRTFEAKEAAGQARPLLFIVLDELNKYAPREGSSPIKEILLDVAERGRSLGVILIGAEQTASEVERRIISNSAIRVVGRLDPAEAARAEYGFLPEMHRKRATIAKPGTMFVSQPQLPVPLVVEFPYPAWATRSSEAVPGSARGESGDDGERSAPADPFAGLPT